MDAEKLNQECIEGRADKLLETRQKEPVPVYRYDGSYAREHGELEQFRASLEENVACKDAIENAIREGFDGMHLSGDAAKGVLSAFGPERVSYVLAATLQEKSYDGRFSKSNLTWAAAIPAYDGSNRLVDYVVNSHPYILDGFVTLARKEMEAIREQPEKKPSIRAQLASAKAAQANQPAPDQQQKHPREAR